MVTLTRVKHLDTLELYKMAPGLQHQANAVRGRGSTKLERRPRTALAKVLSFRGGRFMKSLGATFSGTASPYQTNQALNIRGHAALTCGCLGSRFRLTFCWAFANPTGVPSLSPGLRGTRYPGGRARKIPFVFSSGWARQRRAQPEEKTKNGVGWRLPRVAPAEPVQPWAERWNPVGILGVRAMKHNRGKRVLFTFPN
jgi:hypothetical protein